MWKYKQRKAGRYRLKECIEKRLKNLLKTHHLNIK